MDIHEKSSKYLYGFVKLNFRKIRSLRKDGQICPPITYRVNITIFTKTNLNVAKLNHSLYN